MSTQLRVTASYSLALVPGCFVKLSAVEFLQVGHDRYHVLDPQPDALGVDVVLAREDVRVAHLDRVSELAVAALAELLQVGGDGLRHATNFRWHAGGDRSLSAVCLRPRGGVRYASVGRLQVELGRTACGPALERDFGKVSPTDPTRTA
jgi:hypothetical protein